MEPSGDKVSLGVFQVFEILVERPAERRKKQLSRKVEARFEILENRLYHSLKQVWKRKEKITENQN